MSERGVRWGSLSDSSHMLIIARVAVASRIRAGQVADLKTQGVVVFVDAQGRGGGSDTRQ